MLFDIDILKLVKKNIKKSKYYKKLISKKANVFLNGFLGVFWGFFLSGLLKKNTGFFGWVGTHANPGFKGSLQVQF